MSAPDDIVEEAFKDWGKPPDPSTFRPGLYEHYKGGRYLALMLVEHHETREPYVVYTSLGHGTVNIRPWAKPGEDSWTDMVYFKDSIESKCCYQEITLDAGQKRPRFKFIGGRR